MTIENEREDMKSIWKKEITLDEINQFGAGCMVEHVHIEMVEKGSDYLKATMPVDHRTKQPYGLLHGGASVVLSETLGSMASYMALDDNHYGLGLEINANHLKSVTHGTVTGTVKPIHLGRSTQVWNVTIRNEAGELTCTSRLTVAVLTMETDSSK